jgi:soluble lytic murein transglycosylase
MIAIVAPMLKEIPKLFSFIGMLVLLPLLGATAPLAAAEPLYRYVDEKGVIHFSNAPTDSRYKKFELTGRPILPLKASPPSAAMHQAIAQTSERHRVDPALVRAVIKAESSFNPSAVSRKGAMGLMQLMPETAISLDIANPYDPEQNISGGVRHLRYLLDRFQGNVPLALAAYNAGETRVSRDSKIPSIGETREYVRRVLRYYKDYRRQDFRKYVSFEAPALTTRLSYTRSN